MVGNIVDVTNAGYVGLAHAPIRKSLKAGKKTPEAKKAESQKNIENTVKVLSVSEILGVKRKRVERYDPSGGYSAKGKPKGYNAK